jgi:hypothetical protein
MNHLLRNNNGIALVTALMLTLISLTIVSYLLLMVTAGVKQSGANKRYRTAIDASYGGADIIMKEIIPNIFINTIAVGSFSPTYSADILAHSLDSCLMDKLTKPSSKWGSGCSNSADATVNSDFQLKLNSISASETYTVYTKIIDTVCSDKRPYPAGKCTGSDLSGLDYLGDGSGTAGGSSGVTVQAMPAIYRIEIVGEKTNNPKEKSKISVLYAY